MTPCVLVDGHRFFIPEDVGSVLFETFVATYQNTQCNYEYHDMKLLHTFVPA
jgi:hypothetical protein